MTFKEIIESAKGYLKENLTPENTTLLTHIDTELDKLVESHKELEKEHDDIKGKLLEVVKGTSFKVEKEPNDIGDKEEEKIPTLDEAFDEAFQEIKEARK